MRRDEGRVVNTPLVFKRVLFQETKKKKRDERGTRPWMKKGKSSALDGESMRERALVGNGREESAKEKVQEGFWATALVMLKHGQEKKMTPELAPSFQTTTPHQWEDV
ncbi:hypothetical protein TNCV_688951 [Trichonephila clavipes]|nr:hypothetical protein TNCV_688951 [Trichonephila clavipes]